MKDYGKILKYAGMLLVLLLVMKFSWNIIIEPMMAKKETYVGIITEKETRFDIFGIVRIFSSGDLDYGKAKRIYRRTRFTKYLIWVDCDDGKYKKVYVKRFLWEKLNPGDGVVKQRGYRWPEALRN